MINPVKHDAKDLAYIAEHVTEWPKGADFIYVGAGGTIHIVEGGCSSAVKYISREQWAAARTLLGYWFPEKGVWPDDSCPVCGEHHCKYEPFPGICGEYDNENVTLETAISIHNGNMAPKVLERRLAEAGKQPRYQDAKGEDWIDEAARTFTAEEFRGAMRFTIGKYNRRMGKKDELVNEIEKMRDYCDRWLEVEKGR